MRNLALVTTAALLLGCSGLFSICPDGERKQPLAEVADVWVGVQEYTEGSDGAVCHTYGPLELWFPGDEDEVLAGWEAYWESRGFSREIRSVHTGAPDHGWRQAFLMTHPDGQLVNTNVRERDGKTVLRISDVSHRWLEPLHPEWESRVAGMRKWAAEIAATVDDLPELPSCTEHPPPKGEPAPWWTAEHIGKRQRHLSDDYQPALSEGTDCSHYDLMKQGRPADAAACAEEIAVGRWLPVFVERQAMYGMPMMTGRVDNPTGFGPDGIFTPGTRGGLLVAWTGSGPICADSLSVMNSEEVMIGQYASPGLAQDLKRRLEAAIEARIRELTRTR
jgi:hypothetical protein